MEIDRFTCSKTFKHSALGIASLGDWRTFIRDQRGIDRNGIGSPPFLALQTQF
jgi:hypothetical protein